MNKELEDMYIDVIEDNVNVSKTSDFKEFLILVAGFIGILFLIIFIADIFSNVFISTMSDKTQIKIEKLFGTLPKDEMYNEKYKKPYIFLLKTREKIIKNDSSLKAKSTFPIIIVDDKEFNAWVMPNGVINFTTTLLDKNLSDEELAFILAHEIGHYKNRDHLKSISRSIIITLTFQMIAGKNSDLSTITNSMSSMNYLSHSRKQEIEADKYAGKMMYKLYGNNNSGIKLFQQLESMEKVPEMMFYFSTHPSNKHRIKVLQKQKY
ncbi:M48 family metallopeptidase [bacterium]|nr:M48 family metallopeptidase [bacterium]